MLGELPPTPQFAAIRDRRAVTHRAYARTSTNLRLYKALRSRMSQNVPLFEGSVTFSILFSEQISINMTFLIARRQAAA